MTIIVSISAMRLYSSRIRITPLSFTLEDHTMPLSLDDMIPSTMVALAATGTVPQSLTLAAPQALPAPTPEPTQTQALPALPSPEPMRTPTLPTPRYPRGVQLGREDSSSSSQEAGYNRKSLRRRRKRKSKRKSRSRSRSRRILRNKKGGNCNKSRRTLKNKRRKLKSKRGNRTRKRCRR